MNYYRNKYYGNVRTQWKKYRELKEILKVYF